MTRLVVVIALAVVLATGTVATAGAASKAPARCPVTVPGPPSPDAGGFDAASVNYGTTKLRVNLWRRGILFAGPLPDGGVMATIEADGTVHAKVGWWRGVRGKLTIRGRRLDGPAPPLEAHVPSGYGRRGFQPTGLLFPKLGCWRVAGSVGATRLVFVVKARTVPRT